jgi:hypothetical protein
MSEVVIARDESRLAELVFDTDDIESVHAPCEVYDVPCTDGCNGKHREIGARYLSLTFKPGKAAEWREVRK